MEPFSIIKFLTGFNIFSGVKLGKLVFYFILITVGIGIYHKTFVAPTFKTTQRVIIQDHGTFYLGKEQTAGKDRFIGAKIWKFELGLSW